MLKLEKNARFAILLIGLLLVAVQGAEAAGRIKFLKTYKYMGTLNEEEGPKGHTFQFVNTGDEAVGISVRTSCGCTVAEFTQTEVVPGDTGFVTLVFDPRHRPGQFKKPATVRANTGQTVTLTIAGQVRPRPKGPQDYYPFVDGNLRFQTNHFVFGAVRDDEQRVMSTILYNDGPQTIRFSRKRSQIPGYIALAMSKSELKPGDTMTVRARYDAALRGEYGFVFDQIYLASSDTRRPMKIIKFSAEIEEHFTGEELKQAAKLSLSADRLTYGKVEEGTLAEKSLSLTNKGRSDLIVRRIYSQCTCLEFDLDKDTIPPGETATLNVIFNTRGRQGSQFKEFYLIANTPSSPLRTIPVSLVVTAKKEE